MGQLLHLATRSAVDEAWEAYRAHMLLAEADRALWTDRAWMEQRAILNRRFDRLFLMQDKAS